MTQTAKRKTELTADEIAAVPLSNRQQHGEYVTYTALSRDGVTKYTPVLRNGKAISCDCPATVPCRHMAAAEFEEEWTTPVKKPSELDAKRAEQLATAEQVAPMILGEQFNSDLPAHIDDELTTSAVQPEDWGTPEEAYLRPGFDHNADYQKRAERYITKRDLEKCVLPQGFSLLA